MKKLLFGLMMALLLVSAWGFSMYNAKVSHESYISQNIVYNYQGLFDHILANSSTYERILENKVITSSNVKFLQFGNNLVGEHLGNYRNMATYFNRTDSDDEKGSVIKVAFQISNYLGQLLTILDDDKVVYSNEILLDEHELERIRLIYELNNAWVETVENVEGISIVEDFGRKRTDPFSFTKRYTTKNVFTNRAFKDDFWIEFINELSSQTSEFLSNHNLDYDNWLK